MLKQIKVALTATILLTGTAAAAPLSGLFDVQAVNVIGSNYTGSQASITNFTALFGADGNASASFAYLGALDFQTNTPDNSTTVASWFQSGGGEMSADTEFSARQLSSPDITTGTATTTFFLFTLLQTLEASEFSVRHDDGMTVYENGSLIGGFLGPNDVRTTNIDGYAGGVLQFLYVATNGDPSVFKVDVTAVPVPAALPLLATGLGLVGYVARRRRRALRN